MASQDSSSSSTTAELESSQPFSSQSEQSQQSQDSAPQFDYVSTKKRREREEKRPSQWVCLVPERVFGDVSPVLDSPSFVSLPDPCTGTTRRYLLGPTGNEIFEVQKFSDEPRSWFIGDSLQTDGSLLLCTPMDPLFLVLPYLLKSKKLNKFTLPDGLLDSETCPHWSLLDRLVNPQQWECICETKELHGDVKVYRYSAALTLKWLIQKVKVLAEGLKEEKVHVGSGVQSSLFIRSKKHTSITEEDYWVYACGIVCDYLPPSLAEVLSRHFQSSVNQESRKHSLQEDSTGEPPMKKEKVMVMENENDCEPLENYYKAPSAQPNPVPSKKQTTSQKALAKVNKKGMKTLSNFFTKS